jgi:hypothetical protein
MQALTEANLKQCVTLQQCLQISINLIFSIYYGNLSFFNRPNYCKGNKILLFFNSAKKVLLALDSNMKSSLGPRE